MCEGGLRMPESQEMPEQMTPNTERRVTAYYNSHVPADRGRRILQSYRGGARGDRVNNKLREAGSVVPVGWGALHVR